MAVTVRHDFCNTFGNHFFTNLWRNIYMRNESVKELILLDSDAARLKKIFQTTNLQAGNTVMPWEERFQRQKLSPGGIT